MSKSKTHRWAIKSSRTPEEVAKAEELTRERLKDDLKAIIRAETTPDQRRRLHARLTPEPEVTRLQAPVSKGDRSLDSELGIAGVREVDDDVTRLLVEQRDGTVHRLGGDNVAKAKRADMSSIVGQTAWTGSKYDGA